MQALGRILATPGGFDELGKPASNSTVKKAITTPNGARMVAIRKSNSIPFPLVAPSPVVWSPRSGELARFFRYRTQLVARNLRRWNRRVSLTTSLAGKPRDLNYSPSVVAARQQPSRLLRLPRLTRAQVILLIAAAVLVLPTMLDVARYSWTTEQGGHGPIILATGGWLLWRELRQGNLAKTRPKFLMPGIGFAILLSVFVVARITGTLEIEAVAMYASLVLASYILVGGATLRQAWFPLLYLGLMFPPPDSIVAAVTQPIKIAISGWAVSLLHALGYPIASAGVKIQIAQYEVLVAAACAGLNSVLSLGAICLFYVYLRHRTNMLNFFIVGLTVVPAAIFSNFARVLILILITYYLGESAAQGFLHDFAGLTMFAVALGTIIALDDIISRLVSQRSKATRYET
jgi:exosortase